MLFGPPCLLLLLALELPQVLTLSHNGDDLGCTGLLLQDNSYDPILGRRLLSGAGNDAKNDAEVVGGGAAVVD